MISIELLPSYKNGNFPCSHSLQLKTNHIVDIKHDLYQRQLLYTIKLFNVYKLSYFPFVIFDFILPIFIFIIKSTKKDFGKHYFPKRGQSDYLIY